MLATKTNFLGGINQLSDITHLGPDEYWLLVNARVRKNAVEAVNLPLEVTGNLSEVGNIQDIIAAGDVLICFAGGKAYYKTTTDWQLIASFGMNSAANRVYCTLIPASSINFVRSVTSSTGSVGFAGPSGASPSALVVMDGINQPWIITLDSSNLVIARPVGTYAAWTKTVPEYAPIANYPLFFNGVLYCAMKDSNGVLNQIVRSVTGNPLNFVIAVDTNGDKTNVSEALGGALAMSTSVDYNNLTALSAINSVEGGFFVGSSKASFIVYPDYNNLIYAEPTFRNQSISSIGPLNQDSVVDVLGDAAFVHDTGIRSFNGIMQFRYEGRNAPFSGPINSLLDGITQAKAATGTHDNYALFALKTIYGDGILFYDMLMSKFVSLDIYPGIGNIRKFATTLVGGLRYTYFMTDDNVYRLFGDTQKAVVTMYGNEVIPTDNNKSVKIQTARLLFNNVVVGGNVEAVLYVNGQISNRKIVALDPNPTNNTVQSSIPFNGGLSNGVCSVAEFNFMDSSPEGDRAGIMIRFDTDGLMISASADVQQGTVWQRIKTLGTLSSISFENFVIIGNDGLPPAAQGSALLPASAFENRDRLNSRLKGLQNVTKFIGTGNHAYGTSVYNAGTPQAILACIDTYWGNLKSQCLFVPGIFDTGAYSSSDFFNYFGLLRYSKVTTEYVDIFLINSGFDVLFAQTELDNSFTPPQGLENSTQFQWLKNQLALSTKRHKWVVMSVPPILNDPTYKNSTDPATIAAFAQVASLPLKEWGVTAVLSGTSNMVEMLDWNGLPVIISGSGGFPVTTNVIAVDTMFLSTTSAAYWEVRVSKLSAEFVCKTIDGTIIDRYFQSI